jgi:hypothetical protein
VSNFGRHAGHKQSPNYRPQDGWTSHGYCRLPKVVGRSAFPRAIWAWCLAIQSAAAFSDAKLVTKVGWVPGIVTSPPVEPTKILDEGETWARRPGAEEAPR